MLNDAKANRDGVIFVGPMAASLVALLLPLP
jgi:hypothetical protein